MTWNGLIAAAVLLMASPAAITSIRANDTRDLSLPRRLSMAGVSHGQALAILGEKFSSPCSGDFAGLDRPLHSGRHDGVDDGPSIATGVTGDRARKGAAHRSPHPRGRRRPERLRGDRSADRQRP